MTFLRRLYSIYCLSIFGGLFLLLSPFFLLLIQRKSWHKAGVWLNHLWARMFFFLCFVPVKREFRSKLDPKNTYIFCANHFSYMDIPLVGLTPIPFKFVGKSSMSKVPFFGYMYKKLHILVDRGKLKSRYQTYLLSRETLEMGLSLMIFPEGGIITTDAPNMVAFKPGAFKTAIECKVPIVPVTMPYNFHFLEDDGRLLPSYRSLKIIYHEPIETSAYTIETMDQLSQQVFDIIADELQKHHPNANNKGDITEDRTFSKVGG
ncbi:MAG: lysophospholipid acyltransferase family protein [Cyclobacteriaceae bacterium]